jgi:hypothetical protein
MTTVLIVVALLLQSSSVSRAVTAGPLTRPMGLVALAFRLIPLRP